MGRTCPRVQRGELCRVYVPFWGICAGVYIVAMGVPFLRAGRTAGCRHRKFGESDHVARRRVYRCKLRRHQHYVYGPRSWILSICGDYRGQEDRVYVSAGTSWCRQHTI
ncbi:hypothetical protein BV25DRAFT_935011 [Artomyces pyxidatus]|uniref:Uncharacterized protein n=1 Tax=Artomyces pyxidatus TaxID=48021 RepID=A0ACB8SXB6_9AGAM|nr:hypothetical protein BV25DRAFT_935011 [Artomyces pyxidatus]